MLQLAHASKTYSFVTRSLWNPPAAAATAVAASIASFQAMLASLLQVELSEGRG